MLQNSLFHGPGALRNRSWYLCVDGL